jgi:uncharacterized protein with HEPN domain
VSRTTVKILQDALAHFEIMQGHTKQDIYERLVIDAACMRLAAGIEALAALDPATREEIFDEVWPLTWGMPNRIAHGYLLVDATIIRQTLVHDVPSIMSRIRLRLDATQTASTREYPASAAEAAHVDMPFNDTGTIMDARVDKIDQA